MKRCDSRQSRPSRPPCVAGDRDVSQRCRRDPQGDLGVDVFVLSFLLVMSDGFVLKGLRGS